MSTIKQTALAGANGRGGRDRERNELGRRPHDSTAAHPAQAFSIALNRTFRGKPRDKSQGWWARYNDCFRPARVTLAQLAAAVREGFAFAPVCRGRRKAENFLHAQHIALDFDAETEACRLDALASDPFIARYAALLYTSPSHTPERPRARVVFLLDEPVSDAERYRAYVAALLARYDLADPKAKDPARLFYGSPNCDLRLLDNVLPLAVLDDLVAALRAAAPVPTPTRPAVPLPRSDGDAGRAERWLAVVCDRLAATPPGGRHDALFRAAVRAGQLAHDGLLDPDLAADALRDAALRAGLDEQDAQRTARDGIRAGLGEPATWFVPTPTPTRAPAPTPTHAPAPAPARTPAPTPAPAPPPAPAPAGGEDMRPGRSEGSAEYPAGAPWPLVRALLLSRRTTATRIDLAALAVLECAIAWCDLPTETPLSLRDVLRRMAAGGYRVNRTQLCEALDFWAGCAKNAPNELRITLGANLTHPVWLPAAEQRWRVLHDLLSEHAAPPPAPLPASVPELAPLLPARPADPALAVLDAPRADLLAQAADAREAHRRQRDRRRAAWRALFERVREGTYDALPPLPAGATLSVPALRRHMTALCMVEGAEVNRVQAVAGLSRHTVLRMARERGLESVPVTEEVPVEHVTESMRKRGVVLREQDGRAVVVRPNVLRRADTLSEQEKRAIAEQQAAQRGRARSRLSVLPQGSDPDARAARKAWRAAQRDHEAENAVAALPRALRLARRPRLSLAERLARAVDDYLDQQWELAPPLPEPPYDPETGEVLHGRARWAAALEIVRARGAQPNAAPAPAPAPERPCVACGTQEATVLLLTGWHCAECAALPMPELLARYKEREVVAVWR